MHALTTISTVESRYIGVLIFQIVHFVLVWYAGRRIHRLKRLTVTAHHDITAGVHLTTSLPDNWLNQPHQINGGTMVNCYGR
jgi:hypothetical protein